MKLKLISGYKILHMNDTKSKQFFDFNFSVAVFIIIYKYLSQLFEYFSQHCQIITKRLPNEMSLSGQHRSVELFL